MSSPIGFREFSEDDYRKFIRTLSDEELVKAGKRLRILCGDVVAPTPGTFDRQLKFAAKSIGVDTQDRSVRFEGRPADY